VGNLAALRVAGLVLDPFQAAADLRAGQLVLAVGRQATGSPLASVTTVQSVGGQLRGWRGAAVGAILRTDGAYGPAFAGAPLVDAFGRLAAIVPAGEWRAAGIAIPAEHAVTVARTLAREGGIPRGYLGIQCHAVAIPPRQRVEGIAPRGLLVVGVAGDSAADRGGLLVGDIVVRVAGEDVESPEQLHALLARTTAGTTHPVVVMRGAVRQALDVTLGRRP
jgi:S1-C subfamily serine protease